MNTTIARVLGTLGADVEQAVADGFRFSWDLSRRIVWAEGPGADFHSLVRVQYNNVLDCDRLGLAIVKMLNAGVRGGAAAPYPARGVGSDCEGNPCAPNQPLSAALEANGGGEAVDMSRPTAAPLPSSNVPLTRGGFEPSRPTDGCAGD